MGQKVFRETKDLKRKDILGERRDNGKKQCRTTEYKPEEERVRRGAVWNIKRGISIETKELKQRH